jgi:hypothetical protein
MKIKHNTVISTDFFADGYYGESSCGWTGEQRTTEVEASKDVADHLASTRIISPVMRGEKQ